MENIELFLKTLADKNRLRILMLLSQQKMCVCELAHILGITQPSVSKHLKRLLQVGIINSQQDGFWTNYFLISSPLLVEVFGPLKEKLAKDEQIIEDRKAIKGLDRNHICK